MIQRIMACTALVLAAALLLCGCGIFGQRIGGTRSPNGWTPSPAPTQAISTVSPGMSPGKTASQDTAGATTKLPEAATAAGSTTRP